MKSFNKGVIIPPKTISSMINRPPGSKYIRPPMDRWGIPIAQDQIKEIEKENKSLIVENATVMDLEEDLKKDKPSLKTGLLKTMILIKLVKFNLFQLHVLKKICLRR